MTLRGRLAACGGAVIAGAYALPAFAQDLGHAATEVVVTASPLRTNADKLATIVESVNRDQLLSNGGASLGEVLRNLPGVSATGVDAGASRPVITRLAARRAAPPQGGLAGATL